MAFNAACPMAHATRPQAARSGEPKRKKALAPYETDETERRPGAVTRKPGPPRVSPSTDGMRPPTTSREIIRFKTIVAAAAAALVAVTFGASAHAGGPTKGTGGINGISLNGMSINGINGNGMSLNAITGNVMSLNAITANGIDPNGVQLKGTTAPALSFAIDGVELPAEAR